ncbi:portal protein, partial [Acinetobacter baumannii]
LLAPTVSRQQSEFLGPIIVRELDILEQAGAFDDMPQKLRDAGGLMDIVYDSPLTRAQMAEEAVGVMRTIEAAGLLAQYDEGE